MFRLGTDCLCRRPGPRVGGFTLPTCWRCSGMFAGLAVALAAAVAFPGMLPTGVVQLLGWSAALGAPSAVDVALQLVSHYRSSPLRRSVTGILLGGGIVPLGKALTCLPAPWQAT